MRAFVFTDTALTSRAGQFVWLEINTEAAENAGFLARFPADALPTFFVIDPRQERPVLRWVGSMNVAQVNDLLDRGRALVTGLALAGTPADEALGKADALNAERKLGEAAEAYRQALAAAPDGWRHYGRAAESLLLVYSLEDQPERGVELARSALPRVLGTPSALGVAAGGLDAALQLPDTRADRGELAAAFEARVRELLEQGQPGVSGDDLSGAHALLVEARKKAQDVAGTRQAAEAWASFLDAEAGKAKTAEERAVFDSHRLSAYLELGQAERALPMLQASERELPGDYNPPARLAVALKELKRWDEALAASERALAVCQGPRRLRVLRTKSEIQAGKGDLAGARRSLEEAIAYARALPAKERADSAVRALTKALEALPPPAPEAPPPTP